MIFNKTYSYKYFKKMSSMPGWYENGNKIGDVIFDMFHPKSVIDFGCGTARIISRLFNKGCEVKGIEGSFNAAKDFTPKEVIPYVTQGDITENIILNKVYEVAICTEVAEHIPTDKSEQLIRNLVKSSNFIVFSAAGLNQVTPCHINLQELSFWEDLFKKYNFIIDVEKTKYYKKELTKYNVKQIYIDNGVIFRGLNEG